LRSVEFVVVSRVEREGFVFFRCEGKEVQLFAKSSRLRFGRFVVVCELDGWIECVWLMKRG
jgi:hypothetical protein